jgi:hypothetical protein
MLIGTKENLITALRPLTSEIENGLLAAYFGTRAMDWRARAGENVRALFAEA